MTATNPLKIRSIHHVELWVGNAKQSAFYYRNGLGFTQFAYAGLETGSRNVTSYALKQGKAQIVLSTSARARRVFRGASAKTWRRGTGHRLPRQRCRRGVPSGCVAAARKPLEEPRTVTDEYGSIRRAAIQTYGDTIHSLISFGTTLDLFFRASKLPMPRDAMPGSCASTTSSETSSSGKMNEWADWYAACSDSIATSTSTTRTSRPNTPR